LTQPSEKLDRLTLSSDDEEIISVAKDYNCEVPFRRPDRLARDDTPSVDALVHALDVHSIGGGSAQADRGWFRVQRRLPGDRTQSRFMLLIGP
jgi:hypothetical protein